MIGRTLDETRMLASVKDERTQMHDATLQFISKRDAGANAEEEKDEDYNFKDFDDAEVEEAEDRIYSEYKKRVNKGSEIMPENMLQELAGNVPLEDMDQSIVMSARNGQFSRPPQIGGKNRSDSSFLDLSAML